MFLDDILAAKKQAIARHKAQTPQAELERALKRLPPVLDFSLALRGPGVRLIAEIKRASPSRGALDLALDPVSQAHVYVENGAAALSVLTEETYFQGSLEDMQAVKNVVYELGANSPVLCKDFIFEPYQVYQARVYGADAILLIMTMLEERQAKKLLTLAHVLGMACLVEVHDETDVAKALNSGARIVGINNRDLRTFETDLRNTQRLRPLIPDGVIVVCESGISRAEEVELARRWGCDAVLVGESLITASDVAAKVHELSSVA